MQARDIMTPDPVVASPGMSIRDVAQLMERESIGIIPVVEDLEQRRLVGVITDRDIVVRCIARGHTSGCTIDDHMTRSDLQTVPPSVDLDEVVALMEQHQVRRVPVITEQGTLAGIISQPDVAITRGSAQPGAIRRLLRGMATRSAPTTNRGEPW